MNVELLGILAQEAIGSDRPIRVARLAQRLGISGRQVRADALELTQAGHPVASSTRPPYGLFIVRTETEKTQYVNQLRSRVLELWKRLRAFDRASADALAGQMKLFEERRKNENHKSVYPRSD